ncbi:YbjN domain-containing protein [Novosphingobium sp. Gsoil 351]|uniref:YbjN domain-containing protein n=1 Tax=Novosphingobium sp. Gsoil 351 TaxID=2675225 RepID=UPI0018A86CE5|nr:YbjN domain-containing protein [Novosphingobium sp. Gsoil 351]
MGLAAPAMAATVAAQKPESLAEALKSAGYDVTTGVDDTGDPVLDLVMNGFKARLLFLDCDEARHDQCGSVQFFSAFDAEGAGMSLEDANLFARRYRYGAVSVTANGDPRLRWDIETGDGIPREVFLASAARFATTVQAMAATLFPKVAAGQQPRS